MVYITTTITTHSLTRAFKCDLESRRLLKVQTSTDNQKVKFPKAAINLWKVKAFVQR